jgi:RNA polymerase sigma-70 factor (ECF subfamily)
MRVARSDAHAISRSIADPDEFASIFERHYRSIFRYFARRYGVDAADTLAGDVFCVAFDRRSTFDGRSDTALPWLYGIASRIGANHARAVVRHRTTVATVASQAREHLANGPAIAAIERLEPDLERALASLAPDDLEALLLRAWEDLSYSEIAATANVPVGTVRSRLNRAKRQLRDSLSKETDHG